MKFEEGGKKVENFWVKKISGEDDQTRRSQITQNGKQFK